MPLAPEPERAQVQQRTGQQAGDAGKQQSRDHADQRLAGPGRLTTNLRLFSDPQDVTALATLVNRAVLGLLGSAFGLMSVVLLQGRAARYPGVTMLQRFGYLGAFRRVTLILRVVIDILRPCRWRNPAMLTARQRATNIVIRYRSGS